MLQGAYEATLLAAALLSRQRGGARVLVFLTALGDCLSLYVKPARNLHGLQLWVLRLWVCLIISYAGGGAFGNRSMWIVDALERALVQPTTLFFPPALCERMALPQHIGIGMC
eukprot:COSAG05_NODE_226_length_13453_cov_12.522315_11_plen_113_part_00